MKRNLYHRSWGNIVLGCLLLIPYAGFAHCDTLDGPVVADARQSLAKGNVNGVLKWVPKGDEAEIRKAFDRTLTVRSQSPAARELADQFFFETLVRIHRAGEGAPFTGLKPAGSVDPVIVQADQALEKGSEEHLLKMIKDDAEKGIRERLAHAREKRLTADRSVEAGREFVAAYIDYVHYVEGLHNATQGPDSHHELSQSESAHNHGAEHQE